MGYESKFYAVRDYGFKSSNNTPYTCSEIVASLDMSKMGYSNTVTEFLDLFDTETPFTIYIGDCDEDGNEVMMEVHEDRYGVPLNYMSDIKKGITQVKKMIKEDDYWRFKLLLNFLKMFEECPENIYIVHYGY